MSKTRWYGARGECQICGRVKVVVRDHNHGTGMIRGWLCEQCNSWLGIYEANQKRVHQRGSSRFWRWVEKYQVEIELHLKRDTGVVYQSRFREKRAPETQKKAIHPIDQESEEAKRRWIEGVRASEERRRSRR